MFALFPFARLAVYAIVLAAMTACLLPDRAKSGEKHACARFPENRLLIGDLQARHFTLAAKGPVSGMPRLPAADDKSVFRRTFGLSLDIAEPIALFRTAGSKTIVLARDRERRTPIGIPVFFIGRERQSLDDLKADAELAAFAPSSSLHDGDDFAAIQFHLRKGGSRFSDIKPFFVCGLPGILLCESSCPGDSALLAASLVDWVMSGDVWPPPVKSSGNEAAIPLSRPCSPVQTPVASDGTAPCPMRREPKAPNRPIERKETPSPPASAILAPKPLPLLVLSFEDETGRPIPPGDVLAAEGRLSIGGVFLTETQDGLAATLPEDALPAAKGIEFLKKLLPHYAILDVKISGSSLVLRVEPLFVHAAGLKVTVENAVQKPIPGCGLRLKVDVARRAGRGWEKALATSQENGLRFKGKGPAYELILPNDVDRNELLINSSPPGAVWLSNDAEGCELEARPEVTIEELRTGVIERHLRTAGPVLIALFSTDAALSERLGAGAIGGFWSEALDLAGSVSDNKWEKKLLARAQSFGPSPETRLLQELQGPQKLAEIGEREAILDELVKGSIEQREPLTILAEKPVARFHLDLALSPLRRDAAIDPLQTLQQESLLLVTGGGGLDGSYFCRAPVQEESVRWSRPNWLTQAKRTFALEVWTESEALALQTKAIALQPEKAPAGVYVCKLDGSKIVLYGVVPAALSDSVRARTFAYVKAQAKAFLEP